MKVTEAPEPTNIIWENRHYTTPQRGMRLLLAIVIILFLLSCSFAIVVSLKKKAKEFNLKYAVGNCDDIEEVYGSSLMQEYAV